MMTIVLTVEMIRSAIVTILTIVVAAVAAVAVVVTVVAEEAKTAAMVIGLVIGLVTGLVIGLVGPRSRSPCVLRPIETAAAAALRVVPVVAPGAVRTLDATLASARQQQRHFKHGWRHEQDWRYQDWRVKGQPKGKLFLLLLRLLAGRQARSLSTIRTTQMPREKDRQRKRWK
jgi:hypothetical protein